MLSKTTRKGLKYFEEDLQHHRVKEKNQDAKIHLGLKKLLRKFRRKKKHGKAYNILQRQKTLKLQNSRAWIKKMGLKS